MDSCHPAGARRLHRADGLHPVARCRTTSTWKRNCSCSSGDDTGENLHGLIPQAAAFNSALLPSAAKGWTQDRRDRDRDHADQRREGNRSDVRRHAHERLVGHRADQGQPWPVHPGRSAEPDPPRIFGLAVVPTTSDCARNVPGRQRQSGGRGNPRPHGDAGGDLDRALATISRAIWSRCEQRSGLHSSPSVPTASSPARSQLLRRTADTLW